MTNTELNITYPSDGMCRIETNRPGVGKIVCDVPTTAFVPSQLPNDPNEAKQIAALANAKELAKVLVQTIKQYGA